MAKSAKEDKDKLLPPKLPSQLNPIDGEDFCWNDEELIQDSLVQDCEVPAQDASRVCIERTLFKNVRLTSIRLDHAELTDVKFDHCDLSGADFSDALLHRTAFIGCKLIGVQFAEASLRNVSFTECIMDLANFRVCDLKQVAFQDGTCAGTDYDEAKLVQTVFRHVNLDGAHFSGTKLAGIDLSTCRFDRLSLSWEDLRGCVVSEAQAVLFAQAFGLVIKSEETENEE